MFDVCKLCHFPCESSIWKWLAFPFHEEFGKDLIGMSDIVKMVKKLVKWQKDGKEILLNISIMSPQRWRKCGSFTFSQDFFTYHSYLKIIKITINLKILTLTKGRPSDVFSNVTTIIGES